MGKRIAYCADGTWDNSGKNTNVYQIFKAMRTTADQIPYYDDGVGSDGQPLEKLAGGAFGAGLFQKIKDGRQGTCSNIGTGFSALNNMQRVAN